MYATVRSSQVKEGKVAEVARLIENEYVRLINDVPGFAGYTLIHLEDGRVASIGLFADKESAEKANEIAQEWYQRTLAPLVDPPLDAHAGEVLFSVGGAQA